MADFPVNFGSPAIPSEWRARFDAYQREFAGRVCLLSACIALVVLPLYQLSDFWFIPSTPLVWFHGLWRLPVFMLALVIAGLYSRRPGDRWAHILLLLLGMSAMTMMAGMFLFHYQAATGAVPRMVHGLILTTAAAAIMSVRGARDLLLMSGLPLLGILAIARSNGAGVLQTLWYLFDPFVMLAIGVLIAEALYRSRVREFLARQKLHQTATTDTLTGLHNRRALDGYLEADHARAVRHGAYYSVIMADLDHFKRVNDRYGHKVGDQVLQHLSDRVQESIRTEDLVGRWGGEEFLVLLRDTDQEEALVVAEKIRRRVEQCTFQEGNITLTVTVSLGVATYQGQSSPSEVVTLADKALYRAKEEGRNRVETIETVAESTGYPV